MKKLSGKNKQIANPIGQLQATIKMLINENFKSVLMTGVKFFLKWDSELTTHFLFFNGQMLLSSHRKGRELKSLHTHSVLQYYSIILVPLINF